MGTTCTLLESLALSDWHNHIRELEVLLKKELQGAHGFLKAVRSELSVERSKYFDDLESKLIPALLEDTDQGVNSFASQMLEYNSKMDVHVQFDLINQISQFSGIAKFKHLQNSISFLKNKNHDEEAKRRLIAVIHKIANQSLSQASKSSAGNAGERIVRAILQSIGLVKDKHYREQYKSETGSDTDFAFPFVDNFNDSKLEVLVAVQMSTNDRARLASSELKRGVVCYVVTGNGLDASSKTLGAIGSQIIESYRQSNIRLVCYAPEIAREINRVEHKLLNKHNEVDYRRLSYLNSHVISFQQFAESMSRFSFLPSAR